MAKQSQIPRPAWEKSAQQKSFLKRLLLGMFGGLAAIFSTGGTQGKTQVFAPATGRVRAAEIDSASSASARQGNITQTDFNLQKEVQKQITLGQEAANQSDLDYIDIDGAYFENTTAGLKAVSDPAILRGLRSGEIPSKKQSGLGDAKVAWTGGSTVVGTDRLDIAPATPTTTTGASALSAATTSASNAVTASSQAVLSQAGIGQSGNNSASTTQATTSSAMTNQITSSASTVRSKLGTDSPQLVSGVAQAAANQNVSAPTQVQTAIDQGNTSYAVGYAVGATQLAVMANAASPGSTEASLATKYAEQATQVLADNANQQEVSQVITQVSASLNETPADAGGGGGAIADGGAISGVSSGTSSVGPSAGSVGDAVAAALPSGFESGLNAALGMVTFGIVGTESSLAHSIVSLAVSIAGIALGVPGLSVAVALGVGIDAGISTSISNTAIGVAVDAALASEGGVIGSSIGVTGNAQEVTTPTPVSLDTPVVDMTLDVSVPAAAAVASPAAAIASAIADGNAQGQNLSTTISTVAGELGITPQEALNIAITEGTLPSNTNTVAVLGWGGHGLYGGFTSDANVTTANVDANPNVDVNISPAPRAAPSPDPDPDPTPDPDPSPVEGSPTGDGGGPAAGSSK